MTLSVEGPTPVMALQKGLPSRLFWEVRSTAPLTPCSAKGSWSSGKVPAVKMGLKLSQSWQELCVSHTCESDIDLFILLSERKQISGFPKMAEYLKSNIDMLYV